MTEVSPQTPYQQVHQLLVQNCQTMNHQGRLGWLTSSSFAALLPYIAPDQSTTAFVTNLLAAAYVHGYGQDTYLRAILDQLQADLAGHREYVALITALLQEENVGLTLFPTGQATWAEDTSLHRALAHFQRMPTDSIPDPALLPTPNTMTIRQNVDFVGRDAELREIAHGLKQHQGVAIAAGIGGVGKTQTAIEWVHRYGQFFTGGVFWLDFSSPEAALVSIGSAGKIYGWKKYKKWDLQKQVERVKRQWQEPIPTLLIFDNCESIELARQYLPVASGARVLLTSRNMTWKDQVRLEGIQQVNIVTLPRGDSIALLQRLREDLSSEDANTIAELVGDLPLALHIAGSYLARYRITSSGNPQTYIAQLQANLLGELEESGKWVVSTDHSLSLRATFEISWKQLRMQEQGLISLAEALLLVLAQFAPGISVPEAWLWAALPMDRDERASVIAVEALRSSGLVESLHLGSVQLHRLIAEMVIELTEPQIVTITAVRVDQVIIEQSPQSMDTTFLSQMEVWLSHAVYRSEEGQKGHDEQRAALLTELAVNLRRLGEYTEVSNYFKEALEIRRKIFGNAHPLTASSLVNLARRYRALRRYEEALALYEEALAIQIAMHGIWHESTALTLNNIGYLYGTRGAHENARILYETTLFIRRKVLGDRHKDTATSLNNLAFMYINYCDDLDLGCKMYEEALSIRQEVYGERHANVALSLHNLASAYNMQGKREHILGDNKVALVMRERARKLYEEALVMKREVYGRKHPVTALTLNNLAVWYQDHGQYDRAMTMFREAYSIRRHVFGDHHLLTAKSLSKLAELHASLGEFDIALDLFEKALAIYKDISGLHHSKTQKIFSNIEQCKQMLNAHGNSKDDAER